MNAMLTQITISQSRRLIPAAILLLAFLACSSLAGCASGGTDDDDGRPVERFEFSSYTELDPLLERFNYTPESWQAGVREVPRIYLTDIPPRWRDRVADEVSVLAKKRIFFRTLAPLVLRANELILADRTRLTAMAKDVAAGRPLATKDSAWLGELAARYRVIDEPRALPGPDALGVLVDELLTRADSVPLSLVLAQGAEESGWGTSRFATEGNAIFGQWTWSGEGIRPEGQREELGDYRIATFETPLKSIMSYLLNLNSHPAYSELRARRAALRNSGERVSGYELAKALTSYSERGPEYVESLHALMRTNQLEATDDAQLGDTPTIYLVPSGPGSK
jgi:Bax protein